MPNPYAPPRAAVRDIVDPAARLVLADPGRRLGASVLDKVIAVAMVAGPFLLFGMAGAAASTPAPESGPGAIVTLGLILSLVGLIAWLWLTLRFVIKNGQSIGKKILGIKVVRKDGTPVSLGRLIVLRNAVVWILAFIPLFTFVDALCVFAESRQCIHDKIADTIVVVA